MAAGIRLGSKFVACFHKARKPVSGLKGEDVMEIAKLISGRDPADIIHCTVDMKVRDVVALLAGKRIGALPVIEGKMVVGIFSERDLIYRIAEMGEACLDRAVGDVMTAPAITVGAHETVLDALGLMTRRRIRHLPVLEDGAMRGFISIGDLVKSRLDEVGHEAEALRNYIQSA